MSLKCPEIWLERFQINSECSTVCPSENNLNRLSSSMPRCLKLQHELQDHLFADVLAPLPVTFYICFSVQPQLCHAEGKWKCPCSPSPFLQSANSSLWTARLMPCGPMIVLATSEDTKGSVTCQHPASVKASVCVRPWDSAAENNQIIAGFRCCLPPSLRPLTCNQ